MRKANLILFLFMVSSTVGAQKKETIGEMLQRLKTSTDSNRVKLLIDIGNYYVGISRNDSNKFYITEALKDAEECGYEHGKSRALTVLGYINKFEGDHTKAMEFYHRALQIKERLQLPVEAAAVKEAMGRVFLDIEEPDKAMKYFVEAKNIYELHKDSARLIPLFGQFASYFEKKNDCGSAIGYYQMMLEVYSSWQQSKSTLIPPVFLANYIAATKKGYAICLVETGKAREAVGILEALYAERKEIGGATRVVTQECLGYAYLRLGDYERSIQNSEEAIRFLKENPGIKLLENLKNLLKNVSDAYRAMGNYEASYNNYVSYKAINDNINKERSIKQISQMQARYETEKKDIQIADLYKQKKFQRIIMLLAIGVSLIILVFLIFMYRSKKIQKRLFVQKEELMVKEKEIEANALQRRMTELEQMALRSQMNPHFIFNSLNSVQHFVLNKDVEGVNKYLGAFAHLVRQTLNNSGKQVISLDEEIKYLDTYLSLEKMKSNNGFAYNINIDDRIDVYSTFIPGMILQPFVENSIRHGVAYKENKAGEISISVSKNGKLVCKIEDNGIGREKAGKKRKTAVSPDFESKGMSITMSRIDTINKLYGANITAHVEDIVDAMGDVAGTRVTVDFPPDLE